jgi:ATP-dependent helicase/nuclease subunit A
VADTLTSAQTLAVEQPGGPILVAAAAGSGKTKVIVERLMRRILRPDVECSVNDFLIITFTKKAAAELRARIAKELAARLAEDPDNRHLQKQQSRVYMTQISTVHAFCADLLREFAYELDIPADFRMLEQTEAAALRERIAGELLEDRYASIDADPALRLLIDGLGAGRDDRRVPGLILGVYEAAQCNPNPARWLEENEARLDLAGITGAEQTVWGAYLLDGLRRCAREQAGVLEGILAELESSESLAKYRPTFAQNAADLRALAARETWDGMRTAAAGLDFGKLLPVRSCDDPALKDRAQAVRKQAQEQVKKWAAEAYGPSETVLEDLAQTADTLRALFGLTRDFTVRYDAEKRRLHGLDFGDLEHLALRLLLEPDGTPSAAARRISERYTEIMVDEYQDTNEVQDAIFRAVSREGANRFFVGDVKQSVYRFRLADPEIFLQKYRAYPDAGGADPRGPQRILLSHNFRSGEAVLEAVNAVFRCCMSPEVGGLDYGEAEALRPGRPLEPLPQTQVELHCLCTRQTGEDEESPEKNRAEAAFAARRIRELLDRHTPVRGPEGLRPVEPGDVVILLRSPKNIAGFYLEALGRLAIPAVSDTGESILDAAEVQALLCLLQVLDNAHQDIPLTGALLSPIFGVPAAALARLRSTDRRSVLWDAAAASYDPALSRAVEIISALREQARLLPLHLLLEKVQQATELEAVYGAMEGGPARVQNLRAFFRLAAAFSEGGAKSLHQLLDHVEELRAQGGVPVARTAANAVTVMSIHKSKGLEFPVVLLCGLSRRFNQEDLKAPVQFHSRLGAGCTVYDRPTHTRFSSIARAAISRQTRAENVSEELRILYVAMTRARDMLIMSCCADALESRLQSLALCLSPETVKLQAAQASCLGDWVLLAALLRTEAGALHAVAGRPAGTEVSAWPWRIEWHDLPALTAAAPSGTEAALPEAPFDLDAVAGQLAFRYPHAAAQTVPSKLTATQLKGRDLDREADDGAPREDFIHLKLRKPSLLRTGRPLTPAQKGTAVHLAMQYLDFSRTADLEQIKEELERMVRDAFLSPEQAAAVDPAKLLRVFEGPLGAMIRGADRVLREFKFSILTPAERWYPEAAGEKVLLQGVTDCCLFRDGKITVVDFKTDRVSPGTEREAGEKYRPQLEAYAAALSRIFGLPVSKRYLYFFETDSLTEIG